MVDPVTAIWDGLGKGEWLELMIRVKMVCGIGLMEEEIKGG